MTKFIELHYEGCEILYNLDYIKRFSPADKGKHTYVDESDNTSVMVDESYEEVKAKILNLKNLI